MASAPDHLSEAAQAAWAILVTGEESPVDLLRLEFAAVQVARAREAQGILDEEGLVAMGGKDGLTPMVHPAVGVERAAQELVRRWTEVRPASKESDDPADDGAAWLACLPTPIRDTA